MLKIKSTIIQSEHFSDYMKLLNFFNKSKMIKFSNPSKVLIIKYSKEVQHIISYTEDKPDYGTALGITEGKLVPLIRVPKHFIGEANIYNFKHTETLIEIMNNTVPENVRKSWYYIEMMAELKALYKEKKDYFEELIKEFNIITNL